MEFKPYVYKSLILHHNTILPRSATKYSKEEVENHLAEILKKEFFVRSVYFQEGEENKEFYIVEEK